MPKIYHVLQKYHYYQKKFSPTLLSVIILLTIIPVQLLLSLWNPYGYYHLDVAKATILPRCIFATVHVAFISHAQKDITDLFHIILYNRQYQKKS